MEEVDNNTKRNFINKPWITLAAAKSCKTKIKLHNKWINARGRPNEAQAKREFKTYRAKLRDIIRTQKAYILKSVLITVGVILKNVGKF